MACDSKLQSDDFQVTKSQVSSPDSGPSVTWTKSTSLNRILIMSNNDPDSHLIYKLSEQFMNEFMV